MIQILNLPERPTANQTHSPVIALKAHITGEPTYEFTFRDAEVHSHDELEILSNRQGHIRGLREGLDSKLINSGAIGAVAIICCEDVVLSRGLSISLECIRKETYHPDWRDRMRESLKVN